MISTDNGASFAVTPAKSESSNSKVIKSSLTPSIASAHSSKASHMNDNPPSFEAWWSTCFQVSIPFFLAGIGTIGAGVILGNVQDTAVFTDISALLILVSSLLGLKGNLDMCLASRLSTLANVGEMETLENIWKMVYGNIALVQVQAIVAAICVSLFAVGVSAIFERSFELTHAVILSASSLTTATSSCFVLDNYVWAAYSVIAAYICVLPLWVIVVYRNKYTKPVLTSGWIPVLSALMISGCGGLVMNLIATQYKNFVVFQPIINGIGGNLVSVQASRISTMLHQSSVPGILPSYTQLWASPFRVLIHGLPHAKTSRILFTLSVVGQLLFVHAAYLVNSETISINYEFVLLYITASSIQVLLLLYLAHFFIHFMWRLKIDPDNSAIPFLTAIGDLSGSSLLAASFVFLDLVLHNPNVKKTY